MQDHFVFRRLVGSSHWTERVRRRIVQISGYSYPVLICGAAGAGKELLARAIHAHGRRSTGPFVPFRAGQVPHSLIASQLFGQAPGGQGLARYGCLGAVRSATGGTLFIEEVGGLDNDSQARLLELLRERRCSRLGEDGAVEVDLRVICSTSLDLAEEARAGRFSFELLYRLSAISIQVASLQERPEDLRAIANHIMARITLESGLPLRQLSPAALALLQSYDWPENVDELEEVLERALLATDSDILDLEDFPELLEAVSRLSDELRLADEGDNQEDAVERVNSYEAVSRHDGVSGHWPNLREMEAKHILATLRESGNNLAIAARLLQLSPEQLQERMLACGVPVSIPKWSLPDNVS